MKPLYQSGDYLFCVKARQLKRNDIVVARTAKYGKILKKIKAIHLVEGFVELEGINQLESITTEEMGPIPTFDILYKVWFVIKHKY